MDEMIKNFETIWRSERLVYKPMEDNDECKKFFHSVNSDPVTYALSMPTLQKPVTKEDDDKIVSEGFKKSHMAVLICLPDDVDDEGNSTAGPKIGYIHLMKRFEMSAMIGLSLHSDFQSKGYGREAINWALDWGFRYGNLHRIAIGTVSYNERALHLYKSLGFKVEGRMREVVYVNLQWHDLIDLSMLFSEWKELRGIQ